MHGVGRVKSKCPEISPEHSPETYSDTRYNIFSNVLPNLVVFVNSILIAIHNNRMFFNDFLTLFCKDIKSACKGLRLTACVISIDVLKQDF